MSKSGSFQCGLSFWHPQWLQKFAKPKYFLIIYGLLGTVQAMSFMYFLVTLTTIEKRFKIPSQTTGILLSGNEISQILLSLILSYAGGQRNRPRWIAWGMVFCSVSCFTLAILHFIYGPGEDSFQLTQEYLNTLTALNKSNEINFNKPLTSSITYKDPQNLCDGNDNQNNKCEEIVNKVPFYFIFLSQFFLGIGNTLYFSLGQTYLDDNTKKTNTPLMFGFAMSLRMIGPIFGVFLGTASLAIFIEPKLTPLIDKKDPKWLGAWWLGWLILGSLMLLLSGLLGLFPKQLPPKKEHKRPSSETPKVLKNSNLRNDEDDYETTALNPNFSSNSALDQSVVTSTKSLPKLEDFPRALKRLLENKLLMFNVISSVFYMLGTSGYMTFLAKYMEIQFRRTSQNATILIGPIIISGMIIGYLMSGSIISKKKPKPTYLLFWNVIVGVLYVIGLFVYLFLYCSNGSNTYLNHDGTSMINLTNSCNANCGCNGVLYNPVCHTESLTTYYSPCHAGCKNWKSNDKKYMECSCLINDFSVENTPSESLESNVIFSSQIGRFPAIPNEKPVRKFTETIVTTTDAADTTEYQFFSTSSKFVEVMTSEETINESFTTDNINDDLNLSTDTERVLDESLIPMALTINESNFLTPGVCFQNCLFGYYMFIIVAFIVNTLGASGRIGNTLVNYRCVSTEDKSFAQGFALTAISSLALIPGPIIFGRIIDRSCLVWNSKCGVQGNCLLYDQKMFRYYMNLSSIVFTTVGILFDVLVWKYGRDLDLYGENAEKRLELIKIKKRVVSPLQSNARND